MLCPKKFENGHLLIHCSRRIHGQDNEEAWVEDDSDTAKAVWTKILKWLEYQIEERLAADAVQGLIFLGVNGSGGLGNVNREQVRAALEFSGENDRTRRLLLEMKPLRTKVQ